MANEKLPDKKVRIRRASAIPLSPVMLKILVGKKERGFVMHQSALTARSKFFSAAMLGKWKEAEEKTVKLPEDDPYTFKLYEQLVYTGCIPCMDSQEPKPKPEPKPEPKSEPKSKPKSKPKPKPKQGKRTPVKECENPEACSKEYEALCKLYVFAEKMQDRGAKDSTIIALVAKIKEEIELCGINNACFPRAGAISFIYANTPSKSPVRSLLCDTFVMYVDNHLPCDYQNVEKVPPEFLWDLACAALTIRPMVDGAALNVENYQ